MFGLPINSNKCYMKIHNSTNSNEHYCEEGAMWGVTVHNSIHFSLKCQQTLDLHIAIVICIQTFLEGASFAKKKPSLEPNFNPMTAVGKNLNVLCCFFQFFITALHKVQNSHNHSTHFDFTQDRRENDTSIQPQWPSSRLPASNLEMIYHFSQTGLK